MEQVYAKARRLCMIGLQCLYDDELDEATERLQSALWLVPNSPYYNAYVGEVYLRMCDFSSALLYYRRAVAIARADIIRYMRQHKLEQQRARDKRQEEAGGNDPAAELSLTPQRGRSPVNDESNNGSGARSPGTRSRASSATSVSSAASDVTVTVIGRLGVSSTTVPTHSGQREAAGKWLGLLTPTAGMAFRDERSLRTVSPLVVLHHTLILTKTRLAFVHFTVGRKWLTRADVGDSGGSGGDGASTTVESDQATQAFTEAIRLHPYHIDFWLFRARAYIQNKAYSTALRTLNEITGHTTLGAPYVDQSRPSSSSSSSSFSSQQRSSRPSSSRAASRPSTAEVLREAMSSTDDASLAPSKDFVTKSNGGGGQFASVDEVGQLASPVATHETTTEELLSGASSPHGSGSGGSGGGNGDAGAPVYYNPYPLPKWAVCDFFHRSRTHAAAGERLRQLEAEAAQAHAEAARGGSHDTQPTEFGFHDDDFADGPGGGRILEGDEEDATADDNDDYDDDNQGGGNSTKTSASSFSSSSFSSSSAMRSAGPGANSIADARAARTHVPVIRDGFPFIVSKVDDGELYAMEMEEQRLIGLNDARRPLHGASSSVGRGRGISILKNTKPTQSELIVEHPDDYSDSSDDIDSDDNDSDNINSDWDDDDVDDVDVDDGQFSGVAALLQGRRRKHRRRRQNRRGDRRVRRAMRDAPKQRRPSTMPRGSSSSLHVHFGSKLRNVIGAGCVTETRYTFALLPFETSLYRTTGQHREAHRPGAETWNARTAAKRNRRARSPAVSRVSKSRSAADVDNDSGGDSDSHSDSDSDAGSRSCSSVPADRVRWTVSSAEKGNAYALHTPGYLFACNCVFFLRAQIFMILDRPDLALSDINWVTHHTPGHPQAAAMRDAITHRANVLYSRAVSALMASRYERCVMTVNRALFLTPLHKRLDFYQLRALAFRRQLRFRRALADLETGVRILLMTAAQASVDDDDSTDSDDDVDGVVDAARVDHVHNALSGGDDGDHDVSANTTNTLAATTLLIVAANKAKVTRMTTEERRAAEAKKRAAEEEQQARAAAHARRVTQLHMQLSNTFQDLGRHCLRCRQYDDAHAALTRAIAINADPSYFVTRGDIARLRSTPRLDDALGDYAHALAICRRHMKKMRQRQRRQRKQNRRTGVLSSSTRSAFDIQSSDDSADDEDDSDDDDDDEQRRTGGELTVAERTDIRERRMAAARERRRLRAAMTPAERDAADCELGTVHAAPIHGLARENAGQSLSVSYNVTGGGVAACGGRVSASTDGGVVGSGGMRRPPVVKRGTGLGGGALLSKTEKWAVTTASGNDNTRHDNNGGDDDDTTGGGGTRTVNVRVPSVTMSSSTPSSSSDVTVSGGGERGRESVGALQVGLADESALTSAPASDAGDGDGADDDNSGVRAIEAAGKNADDAIAADVAAVVASATFNDGDAADAGIAKRSPDDAVAADRAATRRASVAAVTAATASMDVLMRAELDPFAGRDPSVFVRGITDRISIVHFTLGRAAFNNGDFVTAETEFARAIQFAPLVVEYYIVRGDALLHLTDYEAAIHCFEFAHRLRPSHAWAHRAYVQTRALLTGSKTHTHLNTKLPQLVKPKSTAEPAGGARGRGRSSSTSSSSSSYLRYNGKVASAAIDAAGAGGNRSLVVRRPVDKGKDGQFCTTSLARPIRHGKKL